ncbi:isoprenoid synthase domain-containing protein, partial [Suillus subalutaceus]|uniref:isoprenoid synthase domain-containing protein n=1 Tax=Suillus subalutaceus TaxID=48586 RepID=UPI001B8671EC
GALAATCYPDADAFHLRVCSDVFNWMYIMDDRIEYGVIDAREAHESCILALHDPINFDTEQLGGKMCKSFFSCFRKTAGPGCTERFIHRCESAFVAAVKQVDDRAKRHMYDLVSYIAMRRDVSGTKVAFTVIEFVARIDLSDEVMLHPVIMALEDAANDYIAWSNDILSYNKEQSRGDAHWHNIVAVLMHDRGLDLQGAIDYTGQLCKDVIQRLCTPPRRTTVPSSWKYCTDRPVDNLELTVSISSA